MPVEPRIRAPPAEEKGEKEKQPTSRMGQLSKAKVSSSKGTAAGAAAGATKGRIATARRTPRVSHSLLKKGEVKVGNPKEAPMSFLELENKMKKEITRKKGLRRPGQHSPSL